MSSGKEQNASKTLEPTTLQESAEMLVTSPSNKCQLPWIAGNEENYSTVVQMPRAWFPQAEGTAPSCACRCPLPSKTRNATSTAAAKADLVQTDAVTMTNELLKCDQASATNATEAHSQGAQTQSNWERLMKAINKIAKGNLNIFDENMGSSYQLNQLFEEESDVKQLMPRAYAQDSAESMNSSCCNAGQVTCNSDIQLQFIPGYTLPIGGTSKMKEIKVTKKPANRKVAGAGIPPARQRAIKLFERRMEVENKKLELLKLQIERTKKLMEYDTQVFETPNSSNHKLDTVGSTDGYGKLN